jgi:hypothetical protein
MLMTLSIMGNSFSPGGNEIDPRARSPAILCMVATGVSDARLIHLAHTERRGELPAMGGWMLAKEPVGADCEYATASIWSTPW